MVVVEYRPSGSPHGVTVLFWNNDFLTTSKIAVNRMLAKKYSGTQELVGSTDESKNPTKLFRASFFAPVLVLTAYSMHVRSRSVMFCVSRINDSPSRQG